MAEFGVRATELSGPSTAGAQALAPVQRDPITFDTNLLRGAGKILEGLMKPSVDESTKDIEDRYAAGLSNLTQAVETGAIAPGEFERRRVQLFKDVSVQAGGKYGIGTVYKRLGKFHKETEDASGVSENQARAKMITEAEDKMMATGIAEGYFTPEFIRDPAARQMALNIMQDKVYTDDMIKRKQAQTDERWKGVERERGLRKDERDNKDYQRKELAREFLLSNSDTFTSSFGLFINQGQARIARGEDPKVILQEFNSMMATQGNGMIAAMSDSPEAQASFKNMQQALMTMGNDALDPTKLAAFDKGTLDIMLTAAKQSLATNNPDMLQMTGVIGLLGPSAASNAAVNMHSATIVQNLWESRSGKAVSTVRAGAVEPQKAMNKVVADTFEKMKAGGATKEAVAEATNYVNGVMRGLGESKPSDNANLTEALKTMSGTAMAQMVQNGTVDREALMAARVSYEQYVQKDLYNRGKQFFNTPVQLAGRGGRAGETVSVQSQSQLVADEAGNLKVVPHFRNDAFKNDPGAQQSALIAISQLNKNLGDFGVMLRIEAHSMGRTDYAAVLEEYGTQIFPNMFVSKEALKEANAKGFDWNGGDPSLKQSWVRRNDGKQTSGSN